MTFKKSLFLSLNLAFVAANAAATPTEDGLYAVFETSEGTFTAELFYENAPLSSANLVGLAEGTIAHYPGALDSPEYSNFYDGLTFHRVVEGFVIQGGDPAGNGSGGPGYIWPDEVRPELKHDSEGILSMANSGPNTNGSQFFVTLAATPNLNGLHNVFGEIVEGIEVVRTIGATPVNSSDRPTTPVTINELSILRIGEDAQAFDPTFYADVFNPTLPLYGAATDPQLSIDPENEDGVEVRAEFQTLTDYRISVSENLEDWTLAKRIRPSLDPADESPSYKLAPQNNSEAAFVRIEATRGILTDVVDIYSEITIVTSNGTSDFTEVVTFDEELLGTYSQNGGTARSVQYDWFELGPNRAQLLIRDTNNREIQFHLEMTSETAGNVYLRDGNFVTTGTFTATLVP